MNDRVCLLSGRPARPDPPPLDVRAPVRLAGVTKTFGAVQAVRGSTSSSAQGEVVAFLGPNGAGKTTTIDLVLGLSAPSSGEVARAGAAPAPGRRPRAGLGGDAERRAAQGPDRAETVRYTASLFADTRPVADVMPTRASPASPTARWASAPAGSSSGWLRDGPAARPRAAAAGRADHRDGRRGPPGLLGGHPARRRAGPDGAVRHALPGRGGPVCRPDRPDQPGPDRRRRQRFRRSGRWPPAGPSGPGCPEADDSALAALAGRRGSSNDAATASCSHARDSDAVARHLLTHTAARDLEITSRGLEDAFLDPDRHPDHRDRGGDPTMTTTLTRPPIDPTARRVPPLGGFSATVLGIELRRMLRNRRTIIFTLVLPAALLPVLRQHLRLAAERRPRQRRRLHHGVDGALRRRPDRGCRWPPWWPSSGRPAGRGSCG